MGAFKQVILTNNQEFYVHKYVEKDRRQRLLMANSQFVKSFPGYPIESFGLVLIVISGMSLYIVDPSNSSIISTLGVFVGCSKLLPSLQQIFVGWASLKLYEPDIEFVNHKFHGKITIPDTYHLNPLGLSLYLLKMYFRMMTKFQFFLTYLLA